VTDAVIVATARTPIGRARKGSLVDVDAFELAQIAVGEVIERSGIATSDIDDIVVAESLQGGGVIARNIAVRLGLTSVPGLADNRHCAAGLSAVQIASAGIRAGMDHVVVAGGTESLSTSPQTTKPAERGGPAEPWMSPSHPETPDAPTRDMSITVGENTAREMGLTRQDVDAWALYSTENALRSIDEGAFEAEIVPVSVTGPDGEQRMF
jgi:acetyl-CoA acetyltransferase